MTDFTAAVIDTTLPTDELFLAPRRIDAVWAGVDGDAHLAACRARRCFAAMARA